MDEVFGEFRLISRIGRGGFGETFVAEWLGPDGFRPRYCLKRALHPFDESAEARTFLHEAKVLELLRHGSIVRVHGAGEIEGFWWLSMDLVEGMDLGKLLNRMRSLGRPIPIEAAVFIGVRIAEALAFAHACTYHDGTPARVVHRDVKPANVLLSANDGNALLTDFGIAKHALSERTRTGQVKGTVPYMSPEQAMQVRDLDGRSDLFTLGTMLFELLAGRRPFDDRRDTTTMLNISECRFTAELPEWVPSELVALVRDLLQKDPACRPRTGYDVVDRLEALGVRGATTRAIQKLVREVRAAHTIPNEGELTEAADPTEPIATVRDKNV